MAYLSLHLLQMRPLSSSSRWSSPLHFGQARISKSFSSISINTSPSSQGIRSNLPQVSQLPSFTLPQVPKLPSFNPPAGFKPAGGFEERFPTCGRLVGGVPSCGRFRSSVDFWIPPYQVRGRLIKSGMTESTVIPAKAGIQTYVQICGRLVGGVPSCGRVGPKNQEPLDNDLYMMYTKYVFKRWTRYLLKGVKAP